MLQPVVSGEVSYASTGVFPDGQCYAQVGDIRIMWSRYIMC